MRPSLLATILTLAACASASPMWTPAARTSAASCSAAHAPPTAPPWQLVRAAGFTFCVPPTWSSQDGQTWHGSGATLTWGTGIPPRHVVGSVTVRVPVPPGGAMPSPAQVAAAAAAQGQAPMCSTDRRSESVGGEAATLFDIDCEGQHHTGARWEGANLYFQGEAGDAVTAALQLQVYRTIRFVLPPEP